MADIDTKLDRLVDLVETYVKEGEARLGRMDARIDALERSTAADMKHVKNDMETVMELLDELLHDEQTVLRRSGDRCVLDKQRVYDAAAAAGVGRRDMLRRLDEAGVLLRETDGPPRRFTRKTRVGGELVRAVIIITQ